MQKKDTKQRILDKALDLFSKEGYDAVSVGQIAAAVDIKAPSIYNHFPSKQAIFDAIVEATAAQYVCAGNGTDRHPCTGCGAGHPILWGDHGGDAD